MSTNRYFQTEILIKKLIKAKHYFALKITVKRKIVSTTHNNDDCHVVFVMVTYNIYSTVL